MPRKYLDKEVESQVTIICRLARERSLVLLLADAVDVPRIEMDDSVAVEVRSLD